MNYGVEPLERLPKLAAAFAAGDVDFRIVIAAVFRTGLMTEPALSTGLNRAVGVEDRGHHRLARARTGTRGRAYRRRADDERRIEFGDAHDGLVGFWGALRAAAAAPEDTRTKVQRRELAERAKLRPLAPAMLSCAEPCYRPSAASWPMRAMSTRPSPGARAARPNRPTLPCSAVRVICLKQFAAACQPAGSRVT